MTNEEQMQVLKEAIKSNYKGSLAEILQPQQQPQGPEGVAMQQQMPEMPVPPASPPRINPASAQPPVQDNQGHLVQSYQSAPPGLRNLPSGPAEGMLIQKMEKGGTKDPNPKQPTGSDDKAVVSERTFDAFKNLDVVKDSYEFIPNIKPDEMQDYVEYDGKLVDKEILKDYEEIENPVIRKGVLSDIFDQRRLDREEYVGSNILKRYENYKDAGNADYTYETGKEMADAPVYKAMDKVLPALDKLTDAEIQEFTRLINTLSSPYTEAMSENEDFGQGDAFKILMGQDLSGIKKYRKKMGLTKGDILDLVQPGKNAGVATKALASSAKAVIRLKDFKDGGYKPKYPQKFNTGGMDERYAEYEENVFDTDDALSYDDFSRIASKYGDDAAYNAYYGKTGNVALKDDFIKSTKNIGYNPYTGRYAPIDQLQKQFSNVVPEGYDFQTYDPTFIEKTAIGGGQGVVVQEKATNPDPLAEERELGTFTTEDLRDFSGAPKNFDTSTSRRRMGSFGRAWAQNKSGEMGKFAEDVSNIASVGVGGALMVPTISMLGTAGAANVLRQTGRTLLSPMKRYGAKAATDFVNLTSKSPVGQTLMQTAKSKTGNILSGSYNIMKGMAVPKAYSILANQAQSEIKGEATRDNRLQAFKKATDVVPQLSKIKDTFKIGKDLYDKDYDSAALRTVSLLGKKNPIVNYGTKFINKFTNTNLVKAAPEAAENVKGKVIEGISTLKQALTPENRQIAGNRYGGYRKKLRKKRRK